MSNPTRRDRIITALRELGALSATGLSAALHETSPGALYVELAKLKREGLIVSTGDRRQIVYSLAGNRLGTA